jgi:hypothetical protein
VPRSGERAASALQLGRRFGVARRQRQLGAQRVNLRQVVREDDRRLPRGGVFGHLGGDVGGCRRESPPIQLATRRNAA